MKVKESQSLIRRIYKMGTSDRIEAFILQLLSEGDDWVELRRNELAGVFSCSPSQINYVLSTRFNEKNGYVTESRRGGGGYLRIKRVRSSDLIRSYADVIGDAIDYGGAELIVKSLLSNNIITEGEAEVIIAAVSDRSLLINQPYKNIVRASILKNIITRVV